MPYLCIELREYYFSDDIGWLEQRNEWNGLQRIGMIKSKVFEGEEKSEFTQYFIISLTGVDEFAYAVRKHWSPDVLLPVLLANKK